MDECLVHVKWNQIVKVFIEYFVDTFKTVSLETRDNKISTFPITEHPKLMLSAGQAKNEKLHESAAIAVAHGHLEERYPDSGSTQPNLGQTKSDTTVGERSQEDFEANPLTLQGHSKLQDQQLGNELFLEVQEHERVNLDHNTCKVVHVDDDEYKGVLVDEMFIIMLEEMLVLL